MEEKMNFILLVPILFPVIAGVFLLWKREFQKRRSLLIFVGAVLLLTGAFAAVGILGGERRFTAFYLTEELPVFFKLDEQAVCVAGDGRLDSGRLFFVCIYEKREAGKALFRLLPDYVRCAFGSGFCRESHYDVSVL